MNLNDQIKNRMKTFGLTLPYSIRMLPVDEEGMPIEEETVELENGRLTFALSPENSVSSLNELVAKASLGYKYGELLCSQYFNKGATSEQIHSFFNVVQPVFNSFAFKEMKENLGAQAITKEMLEWKMLLESAINIPNPDMSTKLMILNLYVALASNNIIKFNLPVSIKEFEKPAEIMIAMTKEEPSPELLCRTADSIIGRTMRTMIGVREDGKKVFWLRDAKDPMFA